MKKQITILVLAIIFATTLYAQNGVSISNEVSTPDPSAMLDVQSTTKGVLIPRLSSVQRTSISSPASGLLVFDNTTQSFWFFSGSWIELISNETETDPVFEQHPANSITNAGSGQVITTAERNKLNNLENNPAGTILIYAGETLPEGYLWCDGQSYATNLYPDLYTAIGSTWGTAGAGVFNVPDLRGVFLRGVNGSRTGDYADVDVNTRLANANGNKNAVGSLQDDAFQGHRHAPLGNTGSFWGALGNTSNGADAGSGASDNTTGSPSPDGVNGSPRTTSETRPQNVYVNYIIKY